MTTSCLPAKTDIGDHDGTDHQPQDRCSLKLLASEDRQIDTASSCLLAKIGGEAAREWAGQQRVSSSLAVDGFSSQQRARPTSIRPYIASQHLRPIPPTRRQSCKSFLSTGFAHNKRLARPRFVPISLGSARPISIRPYTNGFRSQQLQAARGNSIRPYINALARLPSSGFRSQQLGTARARRTARVQTS